MSNHLTDRERDVVELIALSNKEIARELGVTEGTVKVHLVNIFRKLHVKNRTQLAVAAMALALAVATPAQAQWLWNWPYAPWRIQPGFVAPPLPDPYAPARAAQAAERGEALPVAPPPLAYAPVSPPVVEVPAPVPPPPLGWIYGPLTACADPPVCRTTVVAVLADGANVRAAPNGPVTGSLANGVPIFPLDRRGDWLLVAAACSLAPTYTWSVTAGVPLSVCM